MLELLKVALLVLAHAGVLFTIPSQFVISKRAECCLGFSSVGNSWFRELSVTGVSEKKTPQSSVKMWFNT